MKRTLLITIWLFVCIVLCGRSVGYSADETGNDKVTILENGVYFNGKTFVPFKEMVLKDGKILSIRPVASKMNGHRIPLNGQYVIPGLIDAHEHITGSPALPYVIADPKDNVNSNLMCGVTTVIDLFYPEKGCKEMKQETGKLPQYYATLLMSGPILTAPGGHGTEYGLPTRTITSVAEAKKIADEVIDGGADMIKLAYEADTSNYIPSITLEMVKAIVLTAHKRNKKVFAHIDRVAQAVDCAEVGVDVLAHMPGDGLTDEQLKKIKASGIIIIPTITVLQSATEGHDVKYMSDSLLWKTAAPEYLEKFSRNTPLKPFPSAIIHKYYPSINFYENIRNCIKMKIPILAGTDAGNYGVFHGYSLHNEIQQYVLAGMTNADALCTATQNISMVFPDIKTGKIEEGYDADLVVLNADPLQDIANTKRINMVFHKGMLAKPLSAFVEETKALAFDPSALNISKAKQLPSYISTYSDSGMGGSSEINAQLQKDASGSNYIHLSGKIVQKGYIGFAGSLIALSKKDESLPVDISEFSAIEFDVKGNEETYNVQLLSSLVKDYNYHAKAFKAPKEWQTLRIPFSDIKQGPYGKHIPLDLKTITAVSFIAMGKSYSIDCDIKNIRLVK